MRVNVLGGSHDLRLPIGAWDEISRVEPRPAVLMRRFGAGEWSLQELRAIWEAAIKWSPAPSLYYEEVFEREKMLRMAEIAGEIMLESFVPTPGDEPKKDEAPAETTGAKATASL